MTIAVERRGIARDRAGLKVRQWLQSWQLPGLAAVLALSACLNFLRLNDEGYANGYYAAAVKSMLQSWHNFFFVSFDPGGFVTVDKPPFGFWIQTASAKLFGFHGWSIVLPEALAGVLSVAVLFFLVRRVFGPLAGLLAALALAVTPVSVAVSRNNTIDSLLVLTVLLAAWAVIRATEGGRLRWLVAGMALVGLGFNIKMMEAYLVLPALIVLYLLAAPLRWRTRLLHLVLAGVVLIVVSFAWIATVDLIPASQRPYVGSSQHNSELELALGYNGVERLLGRGGPGPGSRGRTGGTADASRTQDSSLGTSGRASGLAATNPQPTGPGGGGPGGTGENGKSGAFRLLNQQLGGQAGWLLPLALIGLVAAALCAPLRLPHRLSRELVSVRPNSRRRAALLWGTWLLTAGTFFSIAGYFHSYYLSMLAPAVAALAGIGIGILWQAYRALGWRGWLLPAALLVTALVQRHLLQFYPNWSRWLTPIVLSACVAAALALIVARLRLPFLSLRWPAVVVAGALALGVVGMFITPIEWAAATTRGSGGGLPSGGPRATSSFARGARRASGFPGGFGGANGFGPVRSQGNAELIKYLEANRDGAKYLVAVRDANSASEIILQTGQPVMAMGGFLGSDPILTEQQLANDVANGTVRYFLLGGGPGFGSGDSSAQSWVTSHCTVVPSSAWQSSSGSSGSSGFGFGTQQLYDCAAASRGELMSRARDLSPAWPVAQLGENLQVVSGRIDHQ